MMPSTHAEWNPDILHFLPAICWMRVEDEAGRHMGCVLQFLWLHFTLQLHWDV